MEFSYRSLKFGCKGYDVDTVGKNKKAIKEIPRESVEGRPSK